MLLSNKGSRPSSNLSSYRWHEDRLSYSSLYRLLSRRQSTDRLRYG